MSKRLIDTPWPFVAALLAAHPEAGVFVVGGAVRDWLIGLPIKDYDLVVRGLPLETLVNFLKKEGEVNLVGKRFGVIKFRPTNDTRVFDIALPRRERSINFSGAYRDFEIQSDHTLPIEEDLSRRDFTINAMAYDLKTHEVVDPFFGQKDLAVKTIRTVGSAATRFQEDYSRLLRAVRFACRLHFSLSEKTATAIKKLAHHLNDTIDDQWIVAREVISQEFLRAFDARPRFCVELMDTVGLLAMVLPEVKALQHCRQTPPYHTEGTVFDHTMLALDSTQTERFTSFFPEPIPLLSKLAILLHDTGKPAAGMEKDGVIHFYGHEKIGASLTAELCDRLNLGSTPYYPFATEQLVWLVREHLFSIKRKDQAVKLTLLERLFFSKKHPGQSLLHTMLADQLASVPPKPLPGPMPAEALINRLRTLAPSGTLPPPLLSGNDVLECTDIKPGPDIAVILEDVRERQLAGTLADKTSAQAYVKNTYGHR